MSGNASAADFQFVAVRIFEEERVVIRSVIEAQLGTFQHATACFPHDLRHSINLLVSIGPEGDTCSVGLMGRILDASEKLALAFPWQAKSESLVIVTIVDRKSDCGQNLFVKVFCSFDVLYPEIDVVIKACFHAKDSSPLNSELRRE
jgi:hypothetical protein